MQFVIKSISLITLIVAFAFAMPDTGSARDRSTKIEREGLLPGTDFNPDVEAEKIEDAQHGLMNSAISRAQASHSKHMKGNFNDAQYLSAMIAHHEGAVDMAKNVAMNGKDPQVKKWAAEVITSQEREIAEMRGLLRSRGGEDVAAASSMKSSMHRMMATPASADPDTNFVSMMIQHHACAVEMASSAVVASQDDQVVKLSERIINEQVKEIAAYKEWLKGRPRG